VNIHLFSGCSTFVNFVKLTTLSSVLSSAVAWWLRHVTAV